MADAQAPTEISEDGRVLAWRIAVLEEAGYEAWPALLLASADVDLHKAVDLLKQGCSPETALSILT